MNKAQAKFMYMLGRFDSGVMTFDDTWEFWEEATRPTYTLPGEFQGIDRTVYDKPPTVLRSILDFTELMRGLRPSGLEPQALRDLASDVIEPMLLDTEPKPISAIMEEARAVKPQVGSFKDVWPDGRPAVERYADDSKEGLGEAVEVCGGMLYERALLDIYFCSRCNDSYQDTTAAIIGFRCDAPKLTTPD